MSYRPDPHAGLRRAITASAMRHGVTVRLTDIAERPWSSATFTGSRLRFALAIDAGDPAAWLAALPEEDLPVPHRIVADVVVERADATSAMLEALVLDA